LFLDWFSNEPEPVSKFDAVGVKLLCVWAFTAAAAAATAAACCAAI